MTEKIPYVGQIVKNGTGLQVKVPSEIVDFLKLQKGDLLKVEISVLSKQDAESPKYAENRILSGNLTATFLVPNFYY